ncbi:UdgX family uracil-DNA binding protein [Rhodoplanes sp. Z2-YC6860]|uniref:UdgX family uracil-DNA binding protein n=1 Tax=Rhodoplanes sp. Z2-YC6860 TaxID=674703 RepID=UPI00078CDF9B|nr:UdgX family uracil-DNA binding protein [Rhodoplanes sp. Z2-YC6860]AMN39188.1 Uracil-DNA glycosylase superfamily protein [Rhodoplanes sp. Z2-YC6860]
MYRIALKQQDSFEEFRDVVRGFITGEIAPEDISWQVDGDIDLFGNAAPPPRADAAISVPAGFPPLAQDVICHRDQERFALLYKLLWRLTHGERSLLLVASDPLVHRLRLMQKSVGRDTHKMTAFVRFRRVEDDAGERHVAWFEPEHHILRHVSSFFVDRFAAIRWSILTPDGAMHWDGSSLSFGPPVSRDQAPREDNVEDWWRAYYRSTFNPARANPTMQRAEMPKKYWHNLPEAPLIPDLLASARQRTARMIEAEPLAPRNTAGWQPDSAPGHEAGTLEALKTEAAACQRCPLWKPATQTVFGEGPADAAVVFVGEQPGDQEDLAGRPFVGPAGQMFDRALAEAGIDRARVYVTNAVKHFKYEPRGKHRIHKTPNNAEIDHCRWWVEREIELIKPELIVALGATAARSMTGRSLTISRERGRLTTLSGGRAGLITVHPSFLLRVPDADAQAREYRRFVEDLGLVATHLPAIRKAA